MQHSYSWSPAGLLVWTYIVYICIVVECYADDMMVYL